MINRSFPTSFNYLPENRIKSFFPEVDKIQRSHEQFKEFSKINKQITDSFLKNMYKLKLGSAASSQFKRDVTILRTPDKKHFQQLIESLSPKDREDFYRELLESSCRSIQEGSVQPIADLLDAWEESAEILHNAEMMGRIEKAKNDIERGDGIPWNPADFM